MTVILLTCDLVFGNPGIQIEGFWYGAMLAVDILARLGRSE